MNDHSPFIFVDLFQGKNVSLVQSIMGESVGRSVTRQNIDIVPLLFFSLNIIVNSNEVMIVRHETNCYHNHITNMGIQIDRSKFTSNEFNDIMKEKVDTE